MKWISLLLRDIETSLILPLLGDREVSMDTIVSIVSMQFYFIVYTRSNQLSCKFYFLLSFILEGVLLVSLKEAYHLKSLNVLICYYYVCFGNRWYLNYCDKHPPSNIATASHKLYCIHMKSCCYDVRGSHDHSRVAPICRKHSLATEAASNFARSMRRPADLYTLLPRQ